MLVSGLWVMWFSWPGLNLQDGDVDLRQLLDPHHLNPDQHQHGRSMFIHRLKVFSMPTCSLITVCLRVCVCV